MSTPDIVRNLPLIPEARSESAAASDALAATQKTVRILGHVPADCQLRMVGSVVILVRLDGLLVPRPEDFAVSNAGIETSLSYYPYRPRERGM